MKSFKDYIIDNNSNVVSESKIIKRYKDGNNNMYDIIDTDVKTGNEIGFFFPNKGKATFKKELITKDKLETFEKTNVTVVRDFEEELNDIMVDLNESLTILENMKGNDEIESQAMIYKLNSLEYKNENIKQLITKIRNYKHKLL